MWSLSESEVIVPDHPETFCCKEGVRRTHDIAKGQTKLGQENSEMQNIELSLKVVFDGVS